MVMRDWFRGKRGGFVAFLAIAALVAGGLGWAIDAALRLEAAQLQAQAEAELQGRLRLALWRLDSYMIPELAREASRPFSDYSALYVPAPLLDNLGQVCSPGTVRGVSPLVNGGLPEWMSLHFSAPVGGDWWSPQVLPTESRLRLNQIAEVPPENDKGHVQLLEELKKSIKPKELISRIGKQEQEQLITLETAQQSAQQPAQTSPPAANRDQTDSKLGQQPQQSLIDYQSRAGRSQDLNYMQRQQFNPTNNTFYGALANNENAWRNITANPQGKKVFAGPMTAMWVQTAENRERLVVARRVRVGESLVAQGIALNWDALQNLLLAEVVDLFPNARLEPTRTEQPLHPERTMTALPVELLPGEVASAADPGWSPLRIGLALASLAAFIALAAVGLGGWSLIDFSQRRVRFVSAVTHELRTPLTTLRLYLDMLTGGMVRDDKQREEYLQTLNCESDRLNRLVSNVLDFSRLERQDPKLEMAAFKVDELLADVAAAWQARCRECDKELIIDDQLGSEALLKTDRQLLQQVLGNLIDNACKYSRNAEDKRIWLRVRSDGRHRIAIEVEDRGPGVPRAERRSILRPFQRGRHADVTAAGVGLGLALATRWARLLGGRLTVCSENKAGACFRVLLPR
jgi:signal transduction histidine kinase